MKDYIFRSKLRCERQGCYKEIGVSDFVRKRIEARGWPDKNMPIGLCPEHSHGRVPIKRTGIINGRIMVEMADLKLPPHIEVIQGAYFNRLNNRWIGAYKIQKICDDYWANNDSNSIEVKQPNGTIAYKNVKVIQPIIIPQAINQEPKWDDPVRLAEIDERIKKENPDFDKKVAESGKMRIKQYCKHRGFTDANFYVLKKQGLIRFSDESQLSIDVIETDKILDAKKANKHRNRVSGMKYTKKTHKASAFIPAIIDNKPVEPEYNPQEPTQENKEQEKETVYMDLPIPLTDGKRALLTVPEDITKEECQKVLRILDSLKEPETEKENLVEFEKPKFSELCEEESNDISVIWHIENHDGLHEIIKACCKEIGCNWSEIRNGVTLTPDADGIYSEEYMAIVCYSLWSRLPIANRIDWLSTFVNRTPNEVRQILGIYFREYQSSRGRLYDHATHWTVFYDVEINFRTSDLDEYFIRYYKYDHSFKYRA